MKNHIHILLHPHFPQNLKVSSLNPSPHPTQNLLPAFYPDFLSNASFFPEDPLMTFNPFFSISATQNLNLSAQYSICLSAALWQNVRLQYLHIMSENVLDLSIIEVRYDLREDCRSSKSVWENQPSGVKDYVAGDVTFSDDSSYISTCFWHDSFGDAGVFYFCGIGSCSCQFLSFFQTNRQKKHDLVFGLQSACSYKFGSGIDLISSFFSFFSAGKFQLQSNSYLNLRFSSSYINSLWEFCSDFYIN